MKQFTFAIALAMTVTLAMADDVTNACTTDSIPGGAKTVCIITTPTSTTICTTIMTGGKVISTCNTDSKPLPLPSSTASPTTEG